jgi:glutamate dehydrogenase
MSTPNDTHVEDWHRAVVTAMGDQPRLVDFQPQWPLAYIAEASPERAIADAVALSEVTPESPTISFVKGDSGRGRFTIVVAARPRSLAELLPPLQSLGLEVLSERPFEVVRPDGLTCWVYDFHVTTTTLPRDPRSRERLEDAFRAIWSGQAETDAYNQLVVTAGLTWIEAAVMRTYGQYLHQLRTPWGRTLTATILSEHGDITRRLSRLFTLRFDPAYAADGKRQEEEHARIEAEIDGVDNLTADRLLRTYLEVILATVRTNVFVDDFDALTHPVALKLDPSTITAMPTPRPRFEVFVASPRIEGIHLRFGSIARGGLRWSDRHEDLRTEILGLATAQVAKNAVIVPTGAKGGFVLKRPAAPGATLQENGVAGYREFIAALLDVHDDLDVASGKPAVTPGARTYDGGDAYLVVAADKGTATFSDIANGIAGDRGFWLGDAFASGGSAGYDHKAMGITARGAWVSVERHFRELGIDPATDTFTAVGIGDMSGDVFGNGMLLSRTMRLLAAFDHRHIFIDPDPDAATAYAERNRLFAMGRCTWGDYRPEAISAGGGVFPRTAKRIQVTPAMCTALGLSGTTSSLTPAELISAILAAPVDLLWNGGIGTYVKATTEVHADAGDRVNDHVRIDAPQLRARVVGEGGNLGFTQRARIEYALRGGRINTDALDNSAGVGCSDREVNIKIALQRPVRDGMPHSDRLALLESMTDDVARLVLAQNVSVNRLMGQSRQFAADDQALHGRLINDLERRRGLDRAQLALPAAHELVRRGMDGRGLVAPELAVLSAQVKLDLRDALLASSLPDDPAVHGVLRSYFPGPLRHRHPEAVDEHPLRREIIATELANTIVDNAGIGWVHRILENTTATTEDVVRAYLVATVAFDLPRLWERIHAEELSTTVAGELVWESIRMLDRASRWLLNRRPQPIEVREEVARLRPTVVDLFDSVPAWHTGRDHIDYQDRLDAVVAGGAPADLAGHVFGLLERFCLLDVAEIAHELDRPASEVAPLYYLVKERREIDRLLTGVSALPRNDRWSALARLGLRDDLYESIRSIVTSILKSGVRGEKPASVLDHWDATLGERLSKIEHLIAASRAELDLANLAVAARQIRTLALLSN